MQPFLAMILPVGGGGGRPDNSLPGGGWGGGRPDQGLPGDQPEIDNSLPGGGAPPVMWPPPGGGGDKPPTHILVWVPGRGYKWVNVGVPPKPEPAPPEVTPS